MAMQENKNTMDINLQSLSPLLRLVRSHSDECPNTFFYDKKYILINALNGLLSI